MRPSFSALFALTVGGLAVLSLSSLPARADVITLRADEWCPYNCAEASKPGYGVEIAREIFSKAGHTLDYKTVSWSRALDECRKGGIDAVIGTTKKESPTFVFPEEHIGVADNTFVVKKGNPWRYTGIPSLGAIKLGIIQDYGYDGEVGDYVEANTKNKARADVVGGDNALDQNLKKLQAGRVDAVVDAKAVLQYKIGQLNMGEAVEFVGTVDPSLIYVAFSPAKPKSKEYAEIFDRGLAEMRASGQLRAILARYGLEEWK